MKDLLELPIDQYQRYRMAAQATEALRKDRNPFQVLEVGGYPPKLKEFLRDDDVLVTDHAQYKAQGYMSADALTLPFQDDSFDIVMALDVLEHIPFGDRIDFMEEIMGVASKYLIIGSPFDEGGGIIQAAESMLMDFISERHGYEHEFFKEHLIHGLPTLSEALKPLTADDWDVVILPNGYFPRWFGMTLQDYGLEGRDEALRINLRRFYNLYFYPLDNREPAYRRILVASKSGFSDEQLRHLNTLKSLDTVTDWPPMDYLKTITELARLDSQDILMNQISGLEHDLAARDEEIKHLKQYITELTQFTDKVKQFPPYKIYSKLFK